MASATPRIGSRTNADWRSSSDCAASRPCEVVGVIRRLLAAEWACLCELPEFWGGAGKSSTRVVFQRRLDSEVARESSISILLGQEECYEMVLFSCLWQEALSSDFSPTLWWIVFAELLLTSCDQRAGELLPHVADETRHFGWMPVGHLVIGVLYFRTLARLAQQHSSVSFGVLVDDWSINWRTSLMVAASRKVVDALEDTLK